MWYDVLLVWITSGSIGFFFLWFISFLKKTWFGHGYKQLRGPWGIPFIGMLPFIGKRPHETFTEMGKRYGGLFAVKMGFKTVVVLNSREVISDCLLKDISFAGKPDTATMKAFRHVVPTNFATMMADNKWKFLRKTSIKGLSLFASSGSSRLEKVVSEALERMNDSFIAHRGHPFDPKPFIFGAISGITGALTFGRQFRKDDSLLREVLQRHGKIGQLLAFGRLEDYFPLGFLTVWTKVRVFKETLGPISKLMIGHFESHVYNAEVADIADALYQTAAQTPEEELKELGLTRASLLNVSQTLFGAAFATVLETFRWCLNIMAANQRVQRKFQMEIDSVLGSEKVSLENVVKLPYVNATLAEVFRFAPIHPLSLPHQTMANTQCQGYFIPKDAIVVTNIWAVHYDPYTFPEPFQFLPERFLDSNGQFSAIMAQNILPFGVGRRRCIGEHLARQQLLLLFASTLQKFNIQPIPGHVIDIKSAHEGSTRRTLEHKLIITPRVMINCSRQSPHFKPS